MGIENTRVWLILVPLIVFLLSMVIVGKKAVRFTSIFALGVLVSFMIAGRTMPPIHQVAKQPIKQEIKQLDRLAGNDNIVIRDNIGIDMPFGLDDGMLIEVEVPEMRKVIIDD